MKKNQKMSVCRRRAFTLVEIMIVVAIIGLLCAIAVPGALRFRENSRKKTCVNNLRQLNGAKDQAALEHGLATGGDASPFVADYLKKGIPVCPAKDTPYLLNPVGTWAECNAPVVAAEHNAEYNP